NLVCRACLTLLEEPNTFKDKRLLQINANKIRVYAQDFPSLLVALCGGQLCCKLERVRLVAPYPPSTRSLCEPHEPSRHVRREYCYWHEGPRRQHGKLPGHPHGGFVTAYVYLVELDRFRFEYSARTEY